MDEEYEKWFDDYTHKECDNNNHFDAGNPNNIDCTPGWERTQQPMKAMSGIL